MEEVMIICTYGGSWELLSPGTETYIGGRSKVVYVPMNATYQELIDQLCRHIEINIADYIIQLRCVVSLVLRKTFKPPEPVPTAYISELNHDSDVEWFLKINMRCAQGAEVLTPLFVSWQARVSNVATCFVSACGSNRFPERTSPVGSPFVSSFPIPVIAPNNAQRSTSPLPQCNEDSTFDRCDNIAGFTNCERDDHGEAVFQWTERNHNEAGQRNSNEARQTNNDEAGRRDMPHFVGRTMDSERLHDPLQCLPIIPSSSNSQCYALSSSEDVGIVVGKLFAEKSILHQELSVLALRKNFQFRVSKSTTIRFEAKCIYEQCKFHIRATRDVEGAYWQVRKFVEEHTCEVDELPMVHRQGGRRVIGQLIKSKFKDPSRIYTPKNIISDIRNEYGVSLSYDQAWRAREYALKLMTGDPEESYNLLPKYCYMLEHCNPGTITHLQKDDLSHFLYVFCAIGSCLNGFRNFIRPVIAIDGTFLKSAYRGTLFVASCMDGNEQIFPLAFGIADSENDASWEWFLAKLCEAIGQVDNLVFISDCHTSIDKAVRSVFPDAIHGLCAHHISNNLKVKFKFKSPKVDRFMAGFWLAVKAYRVSEFQCYMAALNELNPKAAKYLEEDIGVQRWARAHFPSHRYNIMTTNIAECLNGVLRHARSLPVTTLIEFIRSMLQRWFYDRKTTACATSTTLTQWAHHKLEDNKELAKSMTVLPIDRFQYQVLDGSKDGTVNLSQKTCTCKQFQLDQFPYSHAVAAASYVGLRLNSLWSSYYSVDSLIGAYGEPIFPIGHQSDWVLPFDVRCIHVSPPIVRPASGRPRKKRIPSLGEDVPSKKCSRCQQYGHNRQTCRNPATNLQSR